MEKFQKHISTSEKTTAVLLGLLLGLTVVTQLFFQGDVLLLMLVLAVCEALFCGMVFLPETYEFGAGELVIDNPVLRRRTVIPYDAIWTYDAVGGFRGFQRDSDSVEMILKYETPGGKNRSVACHPKNVLGFTKKLQENCPNLTQESA